MFLSKYFLKYDTLFFTLFVFFSSIGEDTKASSFRKSSSEHRSLPRFSINCGEDIHGKRTVALDGYTRRLLMFMLSPESRLGFDFYTGFIMKPDWAPRDD